MLSALSYVFLLVIVSIPIQSMAFLMGGITPSEIILAELVIFVCAIAYALIGLFMSALARSTLIASVATYALVFALTIGLPVIAGGVTILRESIIYGPTSPSPSVELRPKVLSLVKKIRHGGDALPWTGQRSGAAPPG